MIRLHIPRYVIVIAVLLLAFTWFNFERLTTYIELNSPFPKRWIAVTFTTGDTLYGLPMGFTGHVFHLSKVYALEKFSPQGATSTADVRYSVSKRSDELFLNQTSIVSWEFIPQGSKVLEYLK